MSKLTREDKIEIYERSKKGETVVPLAKSFNVNKIIIHYLRLSVKCRVEKVR